MIRVGGSPSNSLRLSFFTLHCAKKTTQFAVHTVVYTAQCTENSEQCTVLLVLACIGVPLSSLPFLHHLTVTEIQRPPSSSSSSSTSSTLPRSSSASSIHGGLRDKAGCLLEALSARHLRCFYPSPLSLGDPNPPFYPPSPKTISELDT